MKNTPFPPLYFGPILFFSAILHEHQVEFEQWDSYLKQTFRNRLEIAGPNGRQTLSIPVSQPRSSRLIKDCQVDGQGDWRKIHLKSLQAAYRSSPYFEHYEPYFERFYSSEWSTLLDWSMGSLALIDQLLRLELNWSLTSQFRPYTKHDLRIKLAPKGQRDPYPVPVYVQVFLEKYAFESNLSILDALFNMGPSTSDYLASVPISNILN